jgi:hypothetical protein
MTTAQPALLRDRWFASLCLIAFTYLAIASLRSSHPPEREVILILGLALSVFIATSIVIRTSFVGDRVVFGAVGVALLLALITQITLPTGLAAAVIHGLRSVAWILAAICSVVILSTSWRHGAQKE